MEFMGGTGMTPEKEEALSRVARLCEEHRSELFSARAEIARASAELEKLASRCERAEEQLAEAQSAVEAKLSGTGGHAALADVSNGTWYAVKACERMLELAEALARYAGAAKEQADGTAAEISDILYHLTN